MRTDDRTIAAALICLGVGAVLGALGYAAVSPLTYPFCPTTRPDRSVTIHEPRVTETMWTAVRPPRGEGP